MDIWEAEVQAWADAWKARFRKFWANELSERGRSTVGPPSFRRAVLGCINAYFSKWILVLILQRFSSSAFSYLDNSKRRKRFFLCLWFLNHFSDFSTSNNCYFCKFLNFSANLSNCTEGSRIHPISSNFVQKISELCGLGRFSAASGCRTRRPGIHGPFGANCE
jgi:hypothetical protein